MTIISLFLLEIDDHVLCNVRNEFPDEKLWPILWSCTKISLRLFNFNLVPFLFVCMVDRYRPSISVAHLTTQLAFQSEEDCLTWLQELNVTFVANDPTKIDCKASVVTWEGFLIFLKVKRF